MIYKVYFINLAKRNDKRQRTEKELNKLCKKDKVERVEGIDAKAFKTMNELVKQSQNIDRFQPSLFTQETITNSSRYRAKLGCWISHYLIMNRHVNSTSDGWIIIFEDDVAINYGIEDLEQYMRRTIPLHENPDIILLGDRVGVAGMNFLDNISRYPEKMMRYGCESYAVRLKSIPKFINMLRLDTVQGKCSIDNRLADLNKGKIKIVPLEGPALTRCLDLWSRDSDIER